MTEWKRANKEDWPEGTPATSRTLANTAVGAWAKGIHTVYVLKYDSGRERFVYYDWGLGDPRNRGEGPIQFSYLIDLLTGEEFRISEHDDDVAARPIAIQQLPAQVKEHWPMENGKFVRQGVSDKGDGINRDHIREIVAKVTEEGGVPEQMGLL